MPFDSDKQRKAFFAKTGTLRSKTIPSISGRITNIKEKLRKKKLERERKQIEKDKREAEKLRKEAEIELHKERTSLRIAHQREQAQKELKELKERKFERSFAGKVGKSFRKKQQKRREFEKSPEGKALLKRQEIKRKVVEKNLRKGAVATRKFLFG